MTSALKGVEDCGEHSFGVRKHMRVPEAKDLESLRLEPVIACCITLSVFRLCMLAAVEFDHDPRVVRGEVNDVRANRGLTAKLPSRDLTAAEPAP